MHVRGSCEIRSGASQAPEVCAGAGYQFDFSFN